MNNSYEYDLSREDQLKIQRSENNYMIGKLVEDRDPTYFTENRSVQFYVDPLCNDPYEIGSISGIADASDNYIGFDTNQPDSMLPQFYDINDYDSEQRRNDITDYYSGKLIIFHPKYVYNGRKGAWFKNLRIVDLVGAKIQDGAYFEMVPRVQLEPKGFEQLLQKNEYFDLLDYDSFVNESPTYVICGTYVYCSKDRDDFLEASPRNSTRWKCIDISKVVKINLTKIEDYKTGIIRASDNIAFVEVNLTSQINKSIDKPENYEMFEDEKIKQAILEKTRAEEEKKAALTEDDNSADETVLEDTSETYFLDGLAQLTFNNGLQYDQKDLVNFHTCVKTNPLVILAGMSGTGKSRLAVNYAKMLGLSEDNGTLLFMPISPSYTEPGDVLGYLNSMNGLYVPSETGLVQFLKKASENPDQMYMVVFDEMNLSQVEYWFSPFISILEKERDGQFLKLYSSDAHCINPEVYPSKIKIGENVLFIGTVNLDDTTKNFSDRLLDRTFVINLNKISFADFYNYYNIHSNELNKDVVKSKCKSVSQFKSWVKSDGLYYMEAFRNHQVELEFLDELNNLISKYIPDGGISHRVMKNIGSYMLNVPSKNSKYGMDRGEALDIVINQTVMTKIRGTETQLSAMIGHFDDSHSLVDSEISALLDKYSNVSLFEQLRRSIARKAEELNINGFAD